MARSAWAEKRPGLSGEQRAPDRKEGQDEVTARNTAILSRRGLLLGAGCAAAALAVAKPALAAPSILRGAGDVRRINLLNPRTDDRVNAVYWIEGEYVPEVLAEIDHLMRDWRAGVARPIAPQTLDIIAATQTTLRSGGPFHVYSGYRTPETNAMLRRRSRGVAKNSYHIKAMAADVHAPDRSVRQVAAAAAAFGSGGVGRYSRSGFTHVDCGPVRSWGR